MPTLLSLKDRLPTRTGPLLDGSANFSYARNSNYTSEIRRMYGPHRRYVDVFLAHTKAHNVANMNDYDGAFVVKDIKIDPRRTYRYSVWVKATFSCPWCPSFRARPGKVLFGADPQTTTLLDGSATKSGWNTGWNFFPPYHEWVLLVSYVHGDDSASTINTKRGGCYRQCGEKIEGFDDFRFASGTSTAQLKFFYISYRDLKENMYAVAFYDPRFEEITGTETRIGELLHGRGYDSVVDQFTIVRAQITGQVSDITNHSVTELNDVSSAGSGKIISTAERELLLGATSDAIDDRIVKRDIQGGFFAADIQAQRVFANEIVCTSDARTKKDIAASRLGLDFIRRLRPVDFKWRTLSEYPAEIRSKKHEQTVPDDDRLQTGLIAQEVQATMKQLGIQWSGHSIRGNGTQGIQYAALVVPLIQAVKQLADEKQTLNERVEKLEQLMMRNQKQ